MPRIDPAQKYPVVVSITTVVDGGGFKAHPINNPQIWAFGTTEDSAIDALIIDMDRHDRICSAQETNTPELPHEVMARSIREHQHAREEELERERESERCNQISEAFRMMGITSLLDSNSIRLDSGTNLDRSNSLPLGVALRGLLGIR